MGEEVEFHGPGGEGQYGQGEVAEEEGTEAMDREEDMEDKEGRQEIGYHGGGGEGRRSWTRRRR